jgi:hypothetical protein
VWRLSGQAATIANVAAAHDRPARSASRLAGAVAAAVAVLVWGCAATASTGGYVVQRFPAAGSCRPTGSGLYVEPDPRCTPGALNPQVTQATIRETICRRGWSARVRPPESVTEPEKRAAIVAYGRYAGRRLSAYELDHFVPLSLGGAPNSAANLWPEADYPSSTTSSFYLNPKDRLESRLHSLTCGGRMTLRAARQAILSGWVAAYHLYVA